jgi:hypothetical protein
LKVQESTMETKNMLGGGIGVVIGGLLSTFLGLGPIGAVIGALLGGLGGSFLAGKIDTGPSRGRELGSNEPAPIKRVVDAESITKLLDEGDKRRTAGLSVDPAYSVAQDSAFTTLRTAGANPRFGSQIERDTDKFRNKYRDVIISSLQPGEKPDDINNMNLADLVARVDSKFDRELKEKREKLKGYEDYSSVAVTSVPDAARAGLTVASLGIAATPLAKEKISDALKAYDSGDFKKFDEVVASVDGDRWLGGAPRAIFTRKPIREYSDLLIEMKETMDRRDEFFKDREQLLKVATAEVRIAQDEKVRLAEAARQATASPSATAGISGGDSVDTNTPAQQTPAKPTQQPPAGMKRPESGVAVGN